MDPGILFTYILNKINLHVRFYIRGVWFEVNYYRNIYDWIFPKYLERTFAWIAHTPEKISVSAINRNYKGKSPLKGVCMSANIHL